MAGELAISVLARKAPGDATVLGIASLLPGGNFGREGSPVLETSSETLALQIPISISAMLSQLACLGVWCNSTRRNSTAAAC